MTDQSNQSNQSTNKKELIERGLPITAVLRWWMTFIASCLTIIKMGCDLVQK